MEPIIPSSLQWVLNWPLANKYLSRFVFRQFPLMRARVEDIDGAAHLVTGPCPDVPLTVLPPSDDWLTEQHRQVRELTIDTAAGPLWRVALQHCPSRQAMSTAAPSHRAILYFSYCHTLTDGESAGMLHGQLLKNLDDLVGGREPDVSSPELVSLSVEEFVEKERLRLSPGLVRNLLQLLPLYLRRRQHPFLERFVAPFDPTLSADSYCTQMLSQVLPQNESEQLRAMCHRHGVTMNAALSAAVSLAAARLLAGSAVSPEASLPVYLPTRWPVNVRRYLPEARGLHLSAISATLANVRVDDTDGKDFWRLAGRIRDNLDDQFEHRLPLVLMQLAMRLRKPELIIASVKKTQKPSPRNIFLYSIHNQGSLDAVFPKTTHVRPVELHSLARCNPAADNFFGRHCFHTLGGRLFYDLYFTRGRMSEEDTRRFQEEVVSVLRSVAQAGDDDVDREEAEGR